ncbi:DUF3841 domain-containing protein [Anaeromicrobium sediminis]|uniref:DUF3841 domain-containing protein n=1 Tax=Anaeromicrobium sediminis TaxID=1478221 RepID=A0A267MJ17_9FIRM|nr:DUF3841 domain-containing protein [Anaeromicrobium sediminis]PAB58783.1 hypothetical protein CCE28_12870 [Anaeromicrobium sediminis]
MSDKHNKGKIKLWTRQNKGILTDLEEHGVYRVKEEYIKEKFDTIAPFYLKAYKRYTEGASKVVPKPEGVKYPIWLSTTENMMLQPTEDTVVFHLEVPKDYVVITDQEKWGYVINYWYVPLNKEDERKHNEELKKYGIGDESALIMSSKGNFYPLLRDKIKKSWDRLFDNNIRLGDLTQATLWEIKKDWIVDTIHSKED